MDYTCVNCDVKFATPELQRHHFKSEWHRYNLKRRLAELPPVTIERFLEKAAQNLASIANPEEKNLYCRPCRKAFTNDKKYGDHMCSKKHFEMVERNEGVDDTAEYMAQLEREGKATGKKEKVDFTNDDDFEDVDSDDDAEGDIDFVMDTNACIFCNEVSPDLVTNIEHMSIAHSFFIPDTEYCVSLENLIEYLLIKVTKDYICLWCNEKGKPFNSLDSVRKHMTDKGHRKMLYEGEYLAEFVDFYDYSSSYPDQEEGADADDEVGDETEVEGDDYQLVLPSGNTIGHRSLLRYYKQKLNPDRQLVAKKSTKNLHKVLHGYRALGWTSTQQEAAARNARDIHTMKRRYNKLSQQVGVKANKLQHHFREQVNF